MISRLGIVSVLNGIIIHNFISRFNRWRRVRILLLQIYVLLIPKFYSWRRVWILLLQIDIFLVSEFYCWRCFRILLWIIIILNLSKKFFYFFIHLTDNILSSFIFSILLILVTILIARGIRPFEVISDVWRKCCSSLIKIIIRLRCVW